MLSLSLPTPSHRPWKTVVAYVLPAFALLQFATGCGGGGNGDHKVAPRVIAGGGVADTPISGWLNVYAVDGDTDAPIPGAAVRVGADSATAACNGTTDSTGLAVFDPTGCPGLKGKQTITVSAAAYVPATWIGATGVNLTVPLDAKTPAPVPTATVTGTIGGWQDLAPPAAGHQTLGVVVCSQSRRFGAPENTIDQGTRTLTVGLLSADIPANACVRNALVNDCSFRLTARTGPQAHFAVMLDQDTKGTTVDTDDTFSVIGYAVTRGLSLTKDQVVGGETLARIPETDIASTTVTIAGTPSALEDVVFLPVVDLGGEGRFIVPLPGSSSPTGGTARVPKAVGVLAGTKFDVIARAQDAVNDARPISLVWRRALDPLTAITVDGFLPAPGGITVAAGVYSFTAVSGASIHSAQIENATGDAQWKVTLFDGSTSFTLPGLSPDPLPTGMLRFKVTALEVPGIDLGNFKVNDALENLGRLAEDDTALVH